MELLCTQCRGIAFHPAVKGKSHGFSQFATGTWGTFSSYGGMVIQNQVFAQRHEGSCLVTRETSGICMRLGRAIRMLLEMRQETNGTFLVATVILGVLSIFKKSQASSTFETLNSACLSRCQRDVRPPVQIRQGHRAFSRVSIGDTNIPSSCEMRMNLHSSHCG